MFFFRALCISHAHNSVDHSRCSPLPSQRESRAARLGINDSPVGPEEYLELFLTILLVLVYKQQHGEHAAPPREDDTTQDTLERTLHTQFRFYRPSVMLRRCVDYENWRAAAVIADLLHEWYGSNVCCGCALSDLLAPRLFPVNTVVQPACCAVRVTSHLLVFFRQDTLVALSLPRDPTRDVARRCCRCCRVVSCGVAVVCRVVVCQR